MKNTVLLVEGVRFELTSPPYLRWRSTTELSSNVIRTAFTGGSYVFTHKKFLESKLKSYNK